MSYQHTQRRKMIRRFKKIFGEQKWHALFSERIASIVAQRLGPPIGTFEEIVNYNRKKRVRQGFHLFKYEDAE